MLFRSPMVLTVAPKTPASSYAEYVALAQAKGGQLSIASAGNDHTVQVWDAVYQQGIAQKQSAFTYRYHSGSVWTVAWSPDGQRIASAGEDSIVRVWQAV